MWRVLILISMAATPAQAAGFKHRVKDPNAPPLPVIEYYCTDSVGARREMGEVICITASCQTWLAKCDMSLNNPMWRKIQDGCPTATAEPTLIERIKRLTPKQSLIEELPKV